MPALAAFAPSSVRARSRILRTTSSTSNSACSTSRWSATIVSRRSASSATICSSLATSCASARSRGELSASNEIRCSRRALPSSVIGAWPLGRSPGSQEWADQDANLGATDYESAALPLSYRPAGRKLAREVVFGDAFGDGQQQRVRDEAARQEVGLVDGARDDGAGAGFHAV